MATSYIANMQTNFIPELSYKQLRSAHRNIPVPFRLALKDYAEPLIIEKIIRIIPQKRFVAFGKFAGKPIVAKCFLERNKKSPHAKRDIAGIHILENANVPTPALLAHAEDISKHISVLIFERLQDAYSLEWLWQQRADNDELAPLMRAATVELATQHVSGIIQKDLHLKNFLISNKKIFTLDGGSIEQINEPLPRKESLEHLALFFSQLGVGTDELQKQLFDLYTQSRGWLVKPADFEFLTQTVNKYYLVRSHRYQKKILRNCTAFSRIEKFTSLTMYDREYTSDTFQDLLKNPEKYFAAPNAEVLKAGRSSTVIKIKIDGKFLVIKRYNMKGFLHWLRRTFRPSRAFRSWQLAHELSHAAIPTAKPIAFIEKLFLGLRHKSYFIMEYVEGKNLADYFSHFENNNDAYKNTAKQIFSLIQNLKIIHLTHGDLKATNIIINKGRPVIIDLDGMKTHKTQISLKHAVEKELTRFMQNWQNQPQVAQLFQSIEKNQMIFN